MLVDHALRHRIEEQIRDVAGERAADEELHRQVVDALGIHACVGVLGGDPPPRQEVAHGARDRLELLARTGVRRIDHVVGDEVLLVQRSLSTRSLSPPPRRLRCEAYFARLSSLALDDGKDALATRHRPLDVGIARQRLRKCRPIPSSDGFAVAGLV